MDGFNVGPSDELHMHVPNFPAVMSMQVTLFYLIWIEFGMCEIRRLAREKICWKKILFSCFYGKYIYIWKDEDDVYMRASVNR